MHSIPAELSCHSIFSNLINRLRELTEKLRNPCRGKKERIARHNRRILEDSRRRASHAVDAFLYRLTTLDDDKRQAVERKFLEAMILEIRKTHALIDKEEL